MKKVIYSVVAILVALNFYSAASSSSYDELTSPVVSVQSIEDELIEGEH